MEALARYFSVRKNRYKFISFVVNMLVVAGLGVTVLLLLATFL